MNKDLRIALERVDVDEGGAKVTFGIHSFDPVLPDDEPREYTKASRLCRFRVMVSRDERNGDSLDGYAARARKILYGSVYDSLIGIWKELPKNLKNGLPRPDGYA